MRKFSELLGRTPSSSASVRLTDFGRREPLLDHYSNGHDGNGHYSNGHHANGHDGNGNGVNGHNGNGHAGGHHANGHDTNGHHANGFDLDDPSDISARLGEDNEALRNLLVETGRKISELEEFRAAFASVVEPANKALRALEHEKTQNISLRRALTQTRAGYEALQAKYADIEAKAATTESANKQLRQDLEKALEATREVKSGKAEIANELAVARAAIADLERRLTQQAATGLGLSEDNRRLRDQVVEAETKIDHLDGELTAAREKVVFLEGDNRSSQKSLDQAVAETARLSQRLNESETALVTAKARLLKVETTLAEVEAAHDRLTVDLKDTSERYHADNTKLDRQVEALQARASAADKLLVSTRQLLVTRSEEARSSERKAREALFARDTAEKKLGEIKVAIKLKESQVEELEKTRSTLHERSTMLAHSLRSCKVQLDEAEDKIRASNERAAHLATEFNVGRVTFDRRIEELKAMLDEERLERQVVEGALAATRRHSAELQDELSKLRFALRRSQPAEEVAGPLPTSAPPVVPPDEAVLDRGAHAA
jgi:crescentin